MNRHFPFDVARLRCRATMPWPGRARSAAPQVTEDHGQAHARATTGQQRA